MRRKDRKREERKKEKGRRKPGAAEMLSAAPGFLSGIRPFPGSEDAGKRCRMSLPAETCQAN